MAHGPLSVWARPNVVVGLGNEIARDDGVGILAAHRLEPLLEARGDVEVVALPWAGFALLDVLAGRRRAALIDCLVSGAHPADTVVRLDERDFAGSIRLNSFHDVNFPTVLALGRRMGWAMPEEIAIWAVEAAVVDEFGEGLTPPVAGAVERVVPQVLEFFEPQRTAASMPLVARSPAAAADQRAKGATGATV